MRALTATLVVAAALGCAGSSGQQPDWRDEYPTCVAYGEQPSGTWPRFLLVQDVADPAAPVTPMPIAEARRLAESRDRDVYYRTIAVCE